MTIQAWNIVLTAVVAVLVVAYGVWLRNVVTQQLNALEAVIKVKDAEISALKSDTAPAITKAYAEMREHADKMTADVLHLSEQLAEYKRLQQTIKEAQERSLVEVTEKLDHWENVLNKRFLLLVGTEHKKKNETE
jgi:mannose-1-phosphate guanylyltransferase